jgi:hypothetical protein
MPYLFAIITLVLVGLLFWGFRRSRSQAMTAFWPEPRDHFQLWLLMLALFSTSVFLIYLLFELPPSVQ